MRSDVSRWMLLTVFLLALPFGASADWGALNMPVGVTEISKEVYTLHMRIFYICCVIGALVFGVMIYSMYAHRKSKGAVASDFHESTTVEIVWTIVPLIILIAMSIPAAKVLVKMEDFSDSDMTIGVTGYQWRWHYSYLDEGIEFYSQLDREHNAARQEGADIDLEQFGDIYLREVDNPLVVPIGKKIRFLHTAADVIHSWWVPDLSVKKDAIPGFINENWARIDEPGTYRGKCAELCGRDHGFMPIVVIALEQDDYDKWVVEQQNAVAEAKINADRDWQQHELLATGEKIYQSNCMSCHQKEGQGIPGMFPAIGGSHIATGNIDTHIETVLNGVTESAMQGFSGKLSDAELAAVITYQRNSFGNETGDSVQPAQLKAIRQGQQQTLLMQPQLTTDTGVN